MSSPENIKSKSETASPLFKKFIDDSSIHSIQALEPQKSDISLKDLYKLDEVVESKFQTEIEILDEVLQKNKSQNKDRDQDESPKT